MTAHKPVHRRLRNDRCNAFAAAKKLYTIDLENLYSQEKASKDRIDLFRLRIAQLQNEIGMLDQKSSNTQSFGSFDQNHWETMMRDGYYQSLQEKSIENYNECFTNIQNDPKLQKLGKRISKLAEECSQTGSVHPRTFTIPPGKHRPRTEEEIDCWESYNELASYYFKKTDPIYQPCMKKDEENLQKQMRYSTKIMMSSRSAIKAADVISEAEQKLSYLKIEIAMAEKQIESIRQNSESLKKNRTEIENKIELNSYFESSCFLDLDQLQDELPDSVAAYPGRPRDRSLRPEPEPVPKSESKSSF